MLYACWTNRGVASAARFTGLQVSWSRLQVAWMQPSSSNSASAGGVGDPRFQASLGRPNAVLTACVVLKACHTGERRGAVQVVIQIHRAAC